MQTIPLQKAIEQAKANPNSDFATKLRQAIESGKLDQAAQKQGVDLSRFGRPTQPVSNTQPPTVSGVLGEMGQNQKTNIKLPVGFNIPNAEQVSETFSDIKQAGQEIKDSFVKRRENTQEGKIASQDGEQSKLRGVLQGVGQSAGLVADMIGTAYKTAIKIPLSQEQETTLKQKVSEVIQKASQTQTGQVVIEEVIQPLNEWYEQLPPEQQRDVDAVGGVASLASEFIGYGTVKRVANVAEESLGSLFKQVKGQLKQQWDEISPTISIVDDATPIKGVANDVIDVTDGVSNATAKSNIDEALKSPEFGLTKDIAGVRGIGDESKFLTVPEKRKLLEIEPNLGKEYIDTLLKSEDSFDNITPFEKAVLDTEKVITQYDNTVKGMGGEIGKIKDKLKGLQVNAPDVDNVVNDIADTLWEKGVSFNGNRFSLVRGSNSPFSKADIKALNAEIGDTLKNIRNSKSMENLLLGMERLDNKINFNLSSELTNSLQGISKSVRGKLKQIRDKALSKSEAKIFEDFSSAKSFIDDFNKGNQENKIMALLNVVGSKRDLKLKRIADEIKRVTGVDITDYAYLARILSEASGAQSRNRSLLNQYIGEAMTMSPTGIMGRVVESVANKIINVDKLKEIQKALQFKAK